jgi:serine-type D-Ala-D-Ala carboxypeptidase/endopeptidase
MPCAFIERISKRAAERTFRRRISDIDANRHELNALEEGSKSITAAQKDLCMNRKLIATVLLSIAGIVNATPPTLPPRVDVAARQRVENGEYPALIIALVDGGHSYVYAYGKLGNGKLPDADTVFEIGSITKTFTATLLAQAVTKNQLRLDQPIATLLPGFRIPARDGKQITLGDLAMQDSGLPRMPTNIQSGNPDDPYVDYDKDKLKAFLATYSLPRDPGAKYEYSNLGAALLGYALGQHAGSNYESLLRQQIFISLGMSSSAVTTDADMQGRLAQGHDEFGNSVGSSHMGVLAGAGGIRSTGADMLRYLKANMGLTTSALYPAMQLAQTARASGPRPDTRIGLIWMTQHQSDGDVIWHNGLTAGYASFIGFTADRRHGVVILTNTATPVDDLGFATLLADWPLAVVHKSIALTPQALDDYLGAYQLSPTFLIHILRVNDQLAAQATGQGAFPLYSSAKDEFFANVGGIGVSFRRDANGKVTGLVLHQHGDRIASKLSVAQVDALQGNKEITIDPSMLSDYVGRYQSTPDGVFVISVQRHQLMVKIASQPSLPIFANARDKFFYRAVDAKIDFERDGRGRVAALVLHQGGEDERATKLAN